MEAIVYELQVLEQQGFKTTRILLSPVMLEVLRHSYELLTGLKLPTEFREGTFNGLPFITVDNLPTDFEIAVHPTR